MLLPYLRLTGRAFAGWLSSRALAAYQKSV
jgi:hypothetical protein